MTRLEYLTGAVVMTVALIMATKSFACDCRAVAESEQAVTETTGHIVAILEDRHGANWNKVEQAMDAAHGPEWTHQLAPAQWSTLHDLRQSLRSGPRVTCPK